MEPNAFNRRRLFVRDSQQIKFLKKQIGDNI